MSSSPRENILSLLALLLAIIANLQLFLFVVYPWLKHNYGLEWNKGRLQLTHWVCHYSWGRFGNVHTLFSLRKEE